MVFTHSGATGRRTLLVDANPGIITLPTAHSMEFEEYLREQQQALVEPPTKSPRRRPSLQPNPPLHASREPATPSPRRRPRPARIVPTLKPNGRHKADPQPDHLDKLATHRGLKLDGSGSFSGSGWCSRMVCALPS